MNKRKHLAKILIFVCAFLTALPCPGQPDINKSNPANSNRNDLAQPLLQPSSSSEVSLKLRFSWGGGELRAWRGKINFGNSRFDRLTHLGLDAQIPGSIIVNDKELVIQQKAAYSYSGFDLEVKGEPDQSIALEMYSSENPEKILSQNYTLRQLSNSDVSVQLDDSNNRLSIQRAPGDQIRCEFQRQDLIFEAGEAFDLSIRANRTGLIDRDVRCHLKILPARNNNGSNKIWTHQFQTRTDNVGSCSRTPVQVPMPQSEGIYDLVIEYTPVESQSFRIKRAPTIRRAIQVVVLGDQPKATATGQAREIEPSTVIRPQDLVQPSAREQINQFFQVSSENRTLSKLVSTRSGTALELPVGGWQAIPLKIPTTSKPQILEVDYPADLPMQCGISILQKDASGQVALFGFDSGIDVPFSMVDGGESRRRTHQIKFWPTRDSVLLIANRHRNKPTRVLEIRVRDIVDIPQSKSEFAKGRKRMAFYEQPVFSEQFGSSKYLDPNLGQSIDDWVTFYDGAIRLVSHLKENGYRGAFITVVADGSSLFPSALLQPTTRFDTGAFCSSGRDPVRKDVLKLLLKIFHREGLTLVPAFSLNDTIASLESNQKDGSVSMVGFRKGAGDYASERLPKYNPLSPDVQQFTNQMFREFSNRYEDVAGFDGAALICRPDTCTLLPGRLWGYDDVTIESFQKTLTDDEQNQLDSPESMRAQLLGDFHDRWISWRANQMSNHYRQLASVLSRKKKREFYLALIDVFQNTEIASEASPSLYRTLDTAATMHRMGFAPDLLTDRTVKVLNPHRIAPGFTLANQRPDLHVAKSRQLDNWIATSSFRGELFVNRAAWAHFQQLEKRQPFSDLTAPLLRMHQLNGGDSSRERFARAILANDSTMIVDGGWQMNAGEEPESREFFKVFNSLPAARFETIEQHESFQNSGVVVRQLKIDGLTFFYLLNASPWPVKFAVPIEFDGDLNLQSSSSVSFELAESDEAKKLTQIIPPFSITGGKVSNEKFSLRPYVCNLPEDAEQQLRKAYYELRSVLIRSGKAPAIQGLVNEGFEKLSQQNLVGWSIGDQDAGSFSFDSREPKEGENSFLVDNQSEKSVWVRSNSFPAPTTGRLSISVWLKTDTEDQQPPLRISVEKASAGSSYYRFGSVGSLGNEGSENKISKKWKRFAVHFDDLPIGDPGPLRIGFDMMGPGKVWIDECKIYDRWFDENDSKAMTQLFANAGLILERQGDLEACRQILTGYWPTFLREHFSENNSDNNAQSVQPQQRTSSLKQRLNRLTSPKILPYR